MVFSDLTAVYMCSRAGTQDYSNTQHDTIDAGRIDPGTKTAGMEAADMEAPVGVGC